MISKLNKTDFINRLKDNIKIGNPRIKGTPLSFSNMFDKTNEKFYGEYSNSNFQLTKNSVLSPIPYIFEGKFKSRSNSSTKISLKIRPIWFGYLWIRIIPVFAFIFINAILSEQKNNIESEIYAIVNIFLALMFIPIWRTIRQKNRLLKEFGKVFEISEW